MLFLMKRLAGIGIKIKYHMLFLTARKTARRRCDSSVAIISNNQFNGKYYFPELLFIKESSVKNPKDMYETCNFSHTEPENFEEDWKLDVSVKASKEDIQMIEKKQTWELVDHPQVQKVTGVKRIIKTRFNLNTSRYTKRTHEIVKQTC